MDGLANGKYPTEIDEDLHSRQLAVYGRETMRRLFASSVLISGINGLGAEIGELSSLTSKQSPGASRCNASSVKYNSSFFFWEMIAILGAGGEILLNK